MNGVQRRFGLRAKLSISLLGLFVVPFIIIKQLNKTEAFLWQQAQLKVQDQLQHLAFSFAEVKARFESLQNVSIGEGKYGYTFYLKSLAQYFQVDASFSDWQNQQHQTLILEQDGTAIRIAKSNRLTAIYIQLNGVEVDSQDHIKLFLQSKPQKLSSEPDGLHDLAHGKIKDQSGNLVNRLDSNKRPFEAGWNIYVRPGGNVEVLFKSERLVNNEPVFINDSRLKGRWQGDSDQISIELSIPSILMTQSIKLAVRRSSAVYPLQTWSPVISLVESANEIEQWTQKVPLSDGSELRVHTKAGELLHHRLKIDMNEGGYSNRWLSQLLKMQAIPRKAESIKNMIAIDQLERTRSKQSGIWQGGSTAFAEAMTSPDSAQNMMLNGIIALKTPDNKVAGYLSLQQSLASLELVQQKWLSSWLGSLFWVLCLIAIILLGYATLLIWRVRRVATSLKQSIDHKGNVINQVVIDKSSDELGELSINIADVVAKLAVQQEYLKRLSNKLSHELRTPIAVVRGALENLAYEISEQGAESLSRAEHGISRLSLILTRMSEATRIEESLTRSQKELISLSKIIAAYISAISDTHTEIKFELDDTDIDRGVIEGAPELLMQACDKLISNAIDFCNANYPIRIIIATKQEKVHLSIFNVGPHIEGSIDRLFHPLVSERGSLEGVTETKEPSINQTTANGKHTPDSTHLGLGLYVVKIISDYHNAQVNVENTYFESDDGVFSAVKFTLVFDEKAPK